MKLGGKCGGKGELKSKLGNTLSTHIENIQKYLMNK